MPKKQDDDNIDTTPVAKPEPEQVQVQQDDAPTDEKPIEEVILTSQGDIIAAKQRMSEEAEARAKGEQ